MANRSTLTPTRRRRWSRSWPAARTPAQIAAFAVALRMKGETPDEIAGFAEAMRRRIRRSAPTRQPLVDTCGTGGDNAGHLQHLHHRGAGGGVLRGADRQARQPRDLEPRGQRRRPRAARRHDRPRLPRARRARIDLLGIAFLFAPNYHVALSHAAGPRREIAIRTVFNLLGPLTNPAGAKRQLMGVYHDRLVRVAADVLARLGSERAWVVHGLDGLDELTVFAPSHVAELLNGSGA